MQKQCTDRAWEEYLYWQEQDKKTLRKINQLVQDIVRNGYSGIGKPEPLKNELSAGGLAELTTATGWFFEFTMMFWK